MIGNHYLLAICLFHISTVGFCVNAEDTVDDRIPV